MTLQTINEVVNGGKDGKSLAYVFIPQFYNSDGTRTAHFAGWVSVHYFPDKIPNNIDLTKPFEKVQLSDSVIGPNSPYPFAPVTLKGEEIDKVLNGEGVALIWGRVDWSDIFEPNKQQTISFCRLLKPARTTDGKDCRDTGSL